MLALLRESVFRYALAATLSSIGCSAEPMVVPERRDQPAGATASCGTADAVFALQCGGAKGSVGRSISTIDDTVRTESASLPEVPECEPSFDSMGRVVEGLVAAQCEGGPTADGFWRVVHLRARASTVCNDHAVSTKVGLTWRGQVELPAGVHRVELFSESNADREADCRVRLGDELADPIRAGESRLHAKYVTGPIAIPVTFECPSGFAASSCVFADSLVPPNVWELLDLQIALVRVE